MRHLVVDGLRLEYRDLPAALAGRPTLVLLHEGLGCVAMWRDFPDQLAAATACRVVVGSRAGYGGSQAYAAPRTARYLQHEGEVALPAFLAALGIERPLLVGHSDGASIALIFAAAFPERPLALVVMAPHEFVEPETLAGIRAAAALWERGDLPQKLARHHPAQSERVFSEWRDCWLSSEFADLNIVDALPQIRCPVLAIQGEDDEYATMRQIEIIAEKVPGTQLLKLARCGHSPQRDQQAAVLAAVGAFVTRVCAPNGA